MKIVLNAEPYGYSEEAKSLWTAKGYQYQASSWDEISATPAFGDIEVLIVRLGRYVGEDILVKFPSLKYLVSATTGLDHIDRNYLEKHRIELISLRGEDEFLKSIPSTAELSWTLLMNLLRPVVPAVNDVRQGNWNRDQFRGYQAKGKKLGIIGMGRTGSLISRYAKAFGMEVSYYDPFVSEAEAERKDTIDALVEEADIVSLHIHLTPETMGFLDKILIRKMKPGAYVINTSRGKVWDEEAIAEAVRSGRLRGVAADVLAMELENRTESPLYQAMQEGFPVLITPHIGGATWDAMHTCEEFVAEKLIRSL